MTFFIDGTNGVSGVDGSSSLPAIKGSTSSTAGIFYPSANTVAFSTASTERMRIASDGNVGIGTSSPATSFHVVGLIRAQGTSLSAGVQFYNTTAARDYRIIQKDNGNLYITDETATAERFVVTSAGNVGIGGTPSSDRFAVAKTTEGQILAFYGPVANLNYGEYSGVSYLWNSNANLATGTNTAHDYVLGTNNAERIRLQSSGSILIHQNTSADPAGGNVDGAAFGLNFGTYISITRNGGTVGSFNRRANDGNVLEIRQDGVLEGVISVSGTTVTYSAFAGSHWSQLTDNSSPEILRGTVVETIDEMCVWEGEDNEQLAKFKISDTVGSESVYGVFMTWDNDDNINNDAHIVGLGAYIVRIAAGVTVQKGNLLESNGDGCARVQSDNIIRSSTIGKVTTSIPVETYADGSYTVPCVLYCG